MSNSRAKGLRRSECIDNSSKQDKQCTYNVKLTRVRVTIIAVQKKSSAALVIQHGKRIRPCQL